MSDSTADGSTAPSSVAFCNCARVCPVRVTRWRERIGPSNRLRCADSAGANNVTPSKTTNSERRHAPRSNEVGDIELPTPVTIGNDNLLDGRGQPTVTYNL